jgi:phage-related protein
MGLGPAIVPITAAATVALGNMVSALGGAATAAGVFGAAVIPQAQSIKKVSDAQSAYNEAVRKFGKNSDQAKQALADYKNQLDAMPKATQDTAKEFIGLKDDFKKWSDALADNTMPIFTEGLEILRDILPTLTPLVEGASKVFKGLMDELKKKVESDKFKDFMEDMTDWALNGLQDTVDGIKKLAGYAKDFITSDGLKSFIQMGKDDGPKVAGVFEDLAEFMGKFVDAAGPLAGLSLDVLSILADALNSIPKDVLEILAPTILAVAAGLKVLAIAEAIYAGAQWLANAALEGFPLTWIVGAIVAVIAIIVLIATKTTWFQTIWKYVWGFVKDLVMDVWNNFLKPTFDALVWFFTVAIPNAANAVWNAIKTAWNWIKDKVGAVWQWIRDKVLNPIKTFFTETIPNAVTTLKDKVVDGWTRIYRWIKGKATDIKDWVVDKFDAIVDFVRDLPGKISRAASGLFNGIKNAFKGAVNWIIGKWNNLSLGFNGIHIKIPFAPDINIPGFHLRTPNIPYLAKGGIKGRSGLAMVGEAGQELVSLPSGSHVRPHANSQLGSGGGSTPFVVVLQVGDKKLGEILVDPLRKVIKSNGGNVQAYLGG